MEQKIIWMQLLLIGILSSFQSCDKGEVDKVYYEEYYLINNSDYNIVIESYNKTDDGYNSNNYTLNQDSTLCQKLELNFGSTTGIIFYADSVVLRFGGSKEISFTPDTQSSFNIIDKRNYTVNEKSENKREYSYTFTNDDYDNAILLD